MEEAAAARLRTAASHTQEVCVSKPAAGWQHVPGSASRSALRSPGQLGERRLTGCEGLWGAALPSAAFQAAPGSSLTERLWPSLGEGGSPVCPSRTSQQDAPPQLMLLTQRIVDSLPSPLVILSLPSLGLEMSLKARARPMPTVEPPLPENWIWGQKTRVWVPARLLPGS